MLPNIPAAVNDFLGGRTYPFEGTSVLMPQYAPYGDPLTVMICGGSTPVSLSLFRPNFDVTDDF